MSSEPNDQTPDEFETGDITHRIVSIEGVTQTEKLSDLSEGITIPRSQSIPYLQELTRARLAHRLITIWGLTLIGIGIFSVVSILNPQNESDREKSIKELIVLVWTTQVTLVSGALGFYFGSNKN